MAIFPNLFTPAVPEDRQIEGLPGTKTQALVNLARQADDKNVEQLTKERMANVDQGEAMKASLAASQPAQAAIGGQQNQAVSDALAKRAMRNYSSDLNRLQQQQEVKSAFDKVRLADRAFQAQRAVSDLEIKRAEFYRRQIENKKSARNNVISSILGGVGSLGGAALGAAFGGPAGAAMGGQLGGGILGAINPSKPMDYGTGHLPEGSYQPMSNYQVGGY